MCGRYSIATNQQTLAQRFDVDVPATLAPRYNAAPTQNLPVVTQSNDSREVGLFRWGLIPPWAEDPAIGNKMINARAETIAQKPSFREAYRKRRCLVLADGYYEWHATPQGKIPMRFVLNDGDVFALAGLWESWRDGDDRINSFTIITTSANEVAAPIHNRMPVILNRETESLWLDPSVDPAALHELLLPYSGNDLQVYSVSKAVNSPSNDQSTLLERVDY